MIGLPRITPTAAASALGLVLLLAPGSARPAAAQSAPASEHAAPVSAQSQGPLVLQPIPHAVIFTPDVKVTTVNGRTSTLIGGSVGVEMDNRFFLGGAAYGLVAPLDTANMFYAGLLTRYRIVGDDHVQISAGGLIGFGEASTYASFAPNGGYAPTPHHGYYGGYYGYPYYWNGFFVAEPEVSAGVSLSRAARLTVGASYRATAGYYGPESEINGFTGTFGVQFKF